MKKFFLDQFYIQSISSEKTGKIRLKCLGAHEGHWFTFYLYLTSNELNFLLDSLQDTGKKIKKWLSKTFFADLLKIFANTVLVNACWLTIKVIDLTASDEIPEHEYYVENYGFIPDEI